MGNGVCKETQQDTLANVKPGASQRTTTTASETACDPAHTFSQSKGVVIEFSQDPALNQVLSQIKTDAEVLKNLRFQSVTELMNAVKSVYVYTGMSGGRLQDEGDWSFLPDDVDKVKLLLMTLQAFHLDRQLSSARSSLRRTPSMIGAESSAKPRSRILTDNQLLLLSFCSPQLLSAVSGCLRPALLFSLNREGESFGKFSSLVEDYKAPCLVVIKSPDVVSERIVGAFVPEGFIENGSRFYGSADTMLFSIAAGQAGADKPMVVLKTSGFESNYVMFNRSASFMPKGFGFGGDDKQQRLYVAADFSTVTTLVACRTYESGSLFDESSGDYLQQHTIDDLEVWGFGGKAALDSQTYKRDLAEDLKAERRKVDVARMMGNDPTGLLKKGVRAGERAEEAEGIISEYRESKGES